MITSKTEITSDAIARHYDELDNFYRDIWGEHVHHGLWITGEESREQAVEQMAAFIAKQARIAEGMSVCDVGCGYGATARKIANEYNAEVTAVTISPAQHRFAVTREPAPGNPHYVLCDWLKNDLPSESFDTVIAIESSEHMPDKAAFLAEAFRVLRPGGRCVVSAWLAKENASAFESRFFIEPVTREGHMPGMGTESDYRRLFQQTGFAFDTFADLTRQVKKTWPMCAALFLLGLLRDPAYVKFLFNRHKHNRVFALTMLRIWLSYSTRIMRYGVFTADKPH